VPIPLPSRASDTAARPGCGGCPTGRWGSSRGRWGDHRPLALLGPLCPPAHDGVRPVNGACPGAWAYAGAPRGVAPEAARPAAGGRGRHRARSSSWFRSSTSCSRGERSNGAASSSGANSRSSTTAHTGRSGYRVGGSAWEGFLDSKECAASGAAHRHPWEASRLSTVKSMRRLASQATAAAPTSARSRAAGGKVCGLCRHGKRRR